MRVAEPVLRVLDALAKRFGVEVDLSNPDVKQAVNDLMWRIVKHELYSSVNWIVVVLLIDTVSFFIARYIANHMIRKFADYDRSSVWLLFAVIVLFSIMVIANQIFDIIDCLVFPERILMDYVTAMEKQVLAGNMKYWG